MKTILAIVGMPGAGKSEAAAYMSKKEYPLLRFGLLTEKTLKEKGLPLTSENEQIIREQLRKDFGMAAFAIQAKPDIDVLLETHDTIIIDGLYSWEEYTYLKNLYFGLLIVHVYAETAIRYERLGKRTVRPFTIEEAKKRDYHEIEKLHKGGPIAIADYLIENNSDLETLHKNIEMILTKVIRTNNDERITNNKTV